METQIAEILQRLTVMEHSVGVLNHEYGELVTKCDSIDKELKENGKVLVKTSTDIDWFKKFFWIVVAASASSLIAILWQILKG